MPLSEVGPVFSELRCDRAKILVRAERPVRLLTSVSDYLGKAGPLQYSPLVNVEYEFIQPQKNIAYLNLNTTYLSFYGLTFSDLT